MPSLGLSNKAIYDETIPAANERHIKDEYPDNYFVPISMDGTLKWLSLQSYKIFTDFSMF